MKNLDEKNHKQKRKKSTISKIDIREESCKRQLHRHKHHNLTPPTGLVVGYNTTNSPKKS